MTRGRELNRKDDIGNNFEISDICQSKFPRVENIHEPAVGAQVAAMLKHECPYYHFSPKRAVAAFSGVEFLRIHPKQIVWVYDRIADLDCCKM